MKFLAIVSPPSIYHIQGGDITGNLVLVKEIMEYCKEEDLEAYMIMMDFKKA